MSRPALAAAAVAVLRLPYLSGGAGFSVDRCDVAPDNGRPPPTCGDFYAGVWVGGRTNRTPTAGFLEEYSVLVAVTVRMAGVPFDRLYAGVMQRNVITLDGEADKVRLALGRDYWNGFVRERANLIIGENLTVETGTRGFTEGLRWLGDDAPRLVGGDWFHAQPDEEMAGLVQVLRFGGATRVQSFEYPGVT